MDQSKIKIKINMNKRLLCNDNLILFISSVFLVVIYAMLLRKMSVWTVSNDTCSMLVIVNGNLSGTPSPYMYFTNGLVSKMLTILYNSFPVIQWYYLLLIFAVFFSLWVVVYKILWITYRYDKKKSIFFTLISMIILNCIFYDFITKISFTDSSTAAGLALFFILLISDSIHKKDIPIILVLCFLCYGIRESVFIAILPFLLLTFTIRIFMNGIKKNDIILLMSISCTIIVMFFYNNALYKGEYKSILKLNSLRSRIYDYYGEFPDYQDYKKVYDKLGINKNEYEVLNLNNGISSFYNKDALSTIIESIDEKSGSSLNKILIRMSDDFRHVFLSSYDNAFWFLFFMILCGSFVVVIIRKNIYQLMLYIGILAISIFEIFYLLYTGRIIKRASCIIVYAIIYAGLGLFYISGETIESLFQKHSWSVMSIILCIYSLSLMESCGLFYIGNAFYSSKYKECLCLENYYMDHQDNILYLGRDHMEYYDICDLFNPPKRNFYRFGGWIVQTPEWKDSLRNGYKDVWDALAHRRDIVFYADKSEMEIIENKLKDMGYSVRAECERIKAAENVYNIWYINLLERKENEIYD